MALVGAASCEAFPRQQSSCQAGYKLHGRWEMPALFIPDVIRVNMLKDLIGQLVLEGPELGCSWSPCRNSVNGPLHIHHDLAVDLFRVSRRILGEEGIPVHHVFSILAAVAGFSPCSPGG